MVSTCLSARVLLVDCMGICMAFVLMSLVLSSGYSTLTNLVLISIGRRALERGSRGNSTATILSTSANRPRYCYPFGVPDAPSTSVVLAKRRVAY